MKKLLILTAFLGLGYVGVNAQTVAPSSPAQQAPKSVSANKPVAVKADANNVEIANDVIPAPAKTEAKKECSTAEKKSCGSGSTSGKKSCCSGKKTASSAK